ncbi:MAG TPA: SGNH/GDSL hydrolase family protein [Umezawaea sp.]|nr:SGNH/GDSL hydrolase family protein [Umezawaea sp.]
MAQVRLTALGDSFVEGHGDVLADGGFRGWIPRLAERLGLAGGRCRNLGSFGATTQDVVSGQLGASLVNKTPLIGVVVGMNDLISDYEPERFRRNVELIFSTLGGPNTTVFSATYPVIPRITALPESFRRVMSARFDEANEVVRELTARHGVLCLDVARAPEWNGPDLWADDGLHPGPEGHRRFADGMAELVGISTGMTVDAGMWVG